MEYNPCYIDEQKYIKDSIIIPLNAGIRTMDFGKNTVAPPVKEIDEQYLRANANTQFGSNVTTGLQRIIDNSTFNSSKYITDALQGNIHSNTSGYLKNIETRGYDKGIKDDVAVVSYVPNIRGIEKHTLIDTEIELDRKLPIYQATTNIVDMSKQQNIRHTNEIELEPKVMASAYTNPGVNGKGSLDTITSRDYYLRPTMQKGGFENKGFRPPVDRDDGLIGELENGKSKMCRDISKMLGTREF